MTFTPEQTKALEAKLARSNVKQRDKAGIKLDYLEGWFVIQEANRIFGFEGWSRETVELVQCGKAYQNQKSNWVVDYRARVRVTIGGAVREGCGFGSGASKLVGDAHESALKEAETDAMKRAFMTFGNPFGLALYDKSQENVKTVADGYVELALGVIEHTLKTREGAEQWWKDEAQHRREHNLTQEHVNKLGAALKAKFPPEKEAA